MEQRSRRIHRRAQSKGTLLTAQSWALGSNDFHQEGGTGFSAAMIPGFLCGQMPRANSEELKKPTGGMLGACSGQHPVGYRFSLLTLLFSGAFVSIKPDKQIELCLFL